VTRLTRRRALGYAAAAAATAARGGSLPAVSLADQGSETLVAALGGALTLELSAVESYDLFVASGIATHRTRAAMRRCRDHDLAHAHRLRVTIERLGGIPPHAPNPADIPSLTAATTEPAALDFAIALEEQTIGSYIAIFRMIHNRSLVRTLGSIMTSDAQQLVVLRQLAGSPPVPSAFEQGSAP
jgi:bacterioferritin (cytochrome b1)